MNKLVNKIISVILIPVTMIFIMSSSILVPLVDRNFFYIQIDDLEIIEECNDHGIDINRYEVIDAYDDVLDFIWHNKEFKTGKLLFSEEGKSHFEDCKKLFLLDYYAFLASSITLLVILILLVLKIVRITDFKGYSPIFYSSIFLLLFIIIVGGLAATDFNSAFEIFHKIFFPGKDNWMFSPYKDQIILVLREDYFMRCALVIALLLIIENALVITYSIIKHKRKKTNEI